MTLEPSSKIRFELVGTYVEREGERARTIHERRLIAGEDAEFSRFEGVAGIHVNTPHGPIRQQIQFPIPADTLDEAFARFDAEVQVHGQRFADGLSQAMQREQQRIVAATKMPPAPRLIKP